MATPISHKSKQKQHTSPINPIESAVKAWLDALPAPLLTEIHSNNDNHHDATSANSSGTTDAIKQLLLSRCPKRWVIYEPMALLPTGSFSAPPWPALLECATQERKDALWIAILANLTAKAPGRGGGGRAGGGDGALTHLAVNEGIPASVPRPSGGGNGSKDGEEAVEEKEHDKQTTRENIIRSPVHLKPLYGVFGPDKSKEQPPSPLPSTPTQADFDAHLWVSTRQNGILQTWCPLYTMFSRGNIKEKARLLNFHSGQKDPPPPGRAAPLHGKWAVDLYAGIGYFAFSYARLGLRVLCWEVNPWSVEGLRRGAEANGFGVRVMMPPSPPPNEEEEDDSLGIDLTTAQERIIVFLEDNRMAAKRIRALRAKARQAQAGGEEGGEQLAVVHVNCGLLPTSRAVWRDAWDMVVVERGRIESVSSGEEKKEQRVEEYSWLHLHENVASTDIETRRAEIDRLVHEWAAEDGGGKDGWVEHVEQVKTYAPGVWHCVFDVVVRRTRNAKVDGGQ